MQIKCPNCQSDNIGTRDHGKKVLGSVATVTGSTAGFVSAMKHTNDAISAISKFSPLPHNTPTVLGAITAGLICGVAGCSAGVSLGQLVDERVLDNYQCLDCDHCFSLTTDREV